MPPKDILEPNEKCALHWMLSYTVNTTFREEEYFEDYDYVNDAPIPPNPHFSVKNQGVIREDIVYNPAKPQYYNCDQRIPISFAPLEMGVIWTRGAFINHVDNMRVKNSQA